MSTYDPLAHLKEVIDQLCDKSALPKQDRDLIDAILVEVVSAAESDGYLTAKQTVLEACEQAADRALDLARVQWPPLSPLEEAAWERGLRVFRERLEQV